MPTANEKIFDEYVRHQTYLLRYAGGLRNQVSDLLRDTEGPVELAILKYAAKLENKRLVDKRSRELMNELGVSIKEAREKAWDEIEETVVSEIKELSVHEAVVAKNIVEAAVPAVLNMALPAVQHLHAIVESRPFEGKVLKEWVKHNKDVDIDRITRQAKMAIATGMTPTEAASLAIGPQGARKAVRDMESVLLTVTNGVQNEAKLALYEANNDVIDREYFVATLDSRTTPDCARNDGKSFELGKGPRPPLHFRCRSLRVPLVDPENLGNRGFDSSTEKQLLKEYEKESGIKAKSRDELPHGHKGKFDTFANERRKQLIGEVPGKTTYEEWLRKQSPDFQNEIMGNARAAVFREGNLRLDEFVAQDGSWLTLAELKNKGMVSKSVPVPKAVSVLNPTKGLPQDAYEIKVHERLFDTGVEKLAQADPGQRNALKKYMSSGPTYKNINLGLRNGTPLEASDLRLKNHLEALLYGNEVNVDVLYRGDTTLPNTLEKAQTLVNTVVTDKAFMSTSTAPRTAYNFGSVNDPNSQYDALLLEFNTKDRPVAGIYATSLRNSKKAEAVFKRAKKTGVMAGETEVLLPTGKQYKIVGLREEFVERLRFDPETKKDVPVKKKILIYEAVFID